MRRCARARSCRPRRPTGDWDISLIDYNIRAERMGWLPSAPQLKTNPLEVSKAAKAAGKAIPAYVAEQSEIRRAADVLRRPGCAGKLAAQPVCLAVEPAGVVAARGMNTSSSTCWAPIMA